MPVPGESHKNIRKNKKDDRLYHKLLPPAQIHDILPKITRTTKNIYSCLACCRRINLDEPRTALAMLLTKVRFSILPALVDQDFP
jgi:hypothetical protein